MHQSAQVRNAKAGAKQSKLNSGDHVFEFVRDRDFQIWRLSGWDVLEGTFGNNCKRRGRRPAYGRRKQQ